MVRCRPGLLRTATVINEDLVVPDLTLQGVAENLKLTLPASPKNHLAGWYYQQFLKMGFAQFKQDLTHYLIWDADTLLIKAIPFFDGNAILLTRGNEYHREYFDTINRLFPNIPIGRQSYISQHLMVRGSDMRALISDLDVCNPPWWVAILRRLKDSNPFQFSEYETYASYCLNRWPDRYKPIERSWFRYGHSYFGCQLQTANVACLADLYDFVAFEQWDSGIARILRALIMVGVKKIGLQRTKWRSKQ